MTEQKFMTAPEVAAHLGINDNAVWLMAKTGALPKPVDLGKDLRWLKTEIEAGVAQ